MLLLLCCTFKKDMDMETFAVKRPLHQEYIMKYKDKISYGGITLNKNGSPCAVYIFLESDDKESALEIAENDPIFSFYHNIRIEQFIQRIPKI